MPAFHVALSFSQPPLWGWVEQFWWEGADVRAALVAGQQLAQARYSILGAGVNLHTVRVSVPQVPRAGLSSPIVGRPLGLPAMPAVAALEVRLTGRTVRTARRSYKLGGWPIGGIVPAGGGLDWAPWLAAAGRAWLALLTQGGWRLLASVPVGPQVAVAGLAEVALDGGDPFGAPANPADPDPATVLVYCQLANPPTTPAKASASGGPL